MDAITPFDNTDPMTLAVIDLFAQGYTVRAVRRALVKRVARVPQEQALVQVAISYADQIRERRKQLASEVLSAGPIRPEERIRRLTHVAEIIEDVIEPNTADDPNAQPNLGRANSNVTAYLRTMEQIRREAEMAGLKPAIDPEDPWLLVLQQLKAPSLPSGNSTNDTPDLLLPR
jgi:hypothetical protein